VAEQLDEAVGISNFNQRIDSSRWRPAQPRQRTLGRARRSRRHAYSGADRRCGFENAALLTKRRRVLERPLHDRRETGFDGNGPRQLRRGGVADRCRGCTAVAIVRQCGWREQRERAERSGNEDDVFWRMAHAPRQRAKPAPPWSPRCNAANVKCRNHLPHIRALSVIAERCTSLFNALFAACNREHLTHPKDPQPAAANLPTAATAGARNTVASRCRSAESCS